MSANFYSNMQTFIKISDTTFCIQKLIAPFSKKQYLPISWQVGIPGTHCPEI